MSEQSTLPGVPEEGAELLDLVAKDGGNKFKAGFFYWLRDNFGIWKRFVQEADKVRAAGRDHYSARTIGEYIRHETALREAGEVKINNNAFPDCARLYMHMRKCEGFFELRTRV